MIEYLKIEIRPRHIFKIESKELIIKIETSDKPVFERRQMCAPDDLVSFFDQIFDCAKKEVLKALKK